MKRLALVLVLAVACEDPYRPPPPPSGARPCDPLSEFFPTPIAIATVIAAGRAADGTVYVVDKTPGVPGERRAFVSSGTTLKRTKIASVSETEEDLTVSLNEAADLHIKMEHPGFDAPVTRMGVLRGNLGTATTFDLDIGGEVLTLIAEPDLGGFTLENFAAGEVMYAAATSDGRQLLVLQPSADIVPEKLRLFLGTPDRMVERKIASASFSSFATIVFDVDGKQTSATLTFASSGSAFGGPRLEEGNRTIATLAPLPGSPGDVVDGGAPPRAPAATFTTGLSFLCF